MTQLVRELFGLRKVVPYHPSSTLTPATNLFGVELEIENCPRNHTYYSGQFDWLTVKEDHSLRGDRAYEFVTKPAPLEDVVKRLTSFFATGFGEECYSDRTSIHVHCNVQEFDEHQLASLAMIYSTVEAVLFNFIGHYRDGNIYCVPWAQCRMDVDIVNRLFQDSPLGRDYHPFYRWEKYTALNFKPVTTQGSVEFRHMHGNNDLAHITKWLRILDRMLSYAYNAPISEVGPMIQQLNTSSQYEVFFNAVFGGLLEYSDAYKYMLEEGVIRAKLASISVRKFPTKEEKVPKQPVKRASSKRKSTVDALYREMVEEALVEGNPVPPAMHQDVDVQERLRTLMGNINEAAEERFRLEPHVLRAVRLGDIAQQQPEPVRFQGRGLLHQPLRQTDDE